MLDGQPDLAQVTQPLAGYWSWMGFKVPSNPSCSTVDDFVLISQLKFVLFCCTAVRDSIVLYATDYR